MKEIDKSQLPSFKRARRENPPEDGVLGVRPESLAVEGYQRFVARTREAVNPSEQEDFYDDAGHTERDHLLRWMEHEGAYAVIFDEQYRGLDGSGAHLSYSAAFAMNEDIYNKL